MDNSPVAPERSETKLQTTDGNSILVCASRKWLVLIRPQVAGFQLTPDTFADARRREAQVKRWSRAKRETLVIGDAAALIRLAQSHDHQPCRKP